MILACPRLGKNHAKTEKISDVEIFSRLARKLHQMRMRMRMIRIRI